MRKPSRPLIDTSTTKGDIPTSRITRCEPPSFLAFTWAEESGYSSEVTFEPTPQGENVILVLTRRRLADDGEMISVASGWHTHFGILVDHLSGREPAPFWSAHEKDSCGI
ncbi:SRPBCC domain-containing protein [Brevibacillus borstelensis]|uniref:SRPBCC domain-containing protein n=1 Tax=Brevibacillus borstelensis TaxID=45462 RepID=UPI0030C07E4E